MINENKIVKIEKIVFLIVVFYGIFIFFDCARNPKYRNWYELERPIKHQSNCSINDIMDELPIGFEKDKKPTLEHIDKFKEYLKTELEEKGIFKNVLLSNSESEYEVTGGILDFKNGNGFVRFLNTFFYPTVYLGTGEAKLTVWLKFKDRHSGKTLFGGEFRQEVISFLKSGDKVFKKIASDFAKKLEKQVKKSEKQ